MGDTMAGEDGEDGLPGATFIFPTYLSMHTLTSRIEHLIALMQVWLGS